MTGPRARVRAVIAALCGIALLAAAAIAWTRRDAPAALAPRAAAERPRLMLLTSLPLVFGEQFSLEAAGSPTLRALESRYRVEPIGVANAESLGTGLLLMAHPLAQPAQALVDLDRWVRGGGRVLILADPKLDRPSELPLGHMHRPPPFFADTGLLAHWGLELANSGQAGLGRRTINGRHVTVSSPGRLTGRCPLAGEGLVARCTVGEGAATIIADADLLQPPGASDAEIEANLQFLLNELARLER